MQLARTLREGMKKNGFVTIMELAQASDVSFETARVVLCEQNDPRLTTVTKLLAGVGMKLEVKS